MWSAKEPSVYPEISTHFYPCTGGLFGKQSDKWVNVIDGYEDVDVENQFGMIYVEDNNENSASFIGSDNRHFHGGTYPLQRKVYQCGTAVEPDLPFPVVGVGFQREELIVACLALNNNIVFFKLETNENNVDEWGIVGTIYNEDYLFLNHVYFSKDGTKAVSIATKVEEYERTPFEKNDIYIPYLLEINLSYSGQATYQINANETIIEHSYVAPFTIKFEVTAPFAAEYINNEIKIFKSKIEFIAGDYPRQIYYPPIEGIPEWNANYYYAYWNCVSGEHWRVPMLFWWQVGYSECPGLAIEQYPTFGVNDILVSGNFFSYKISFNDLEQPKAIYTTNGLTVSSQINYSTTGRDGYPDAPYFGPLAKIDLYGISPKIPDFLDGLFSGKHLSVTIYFLAGQIYAYYNTGIETKTFSYQIADYNNGFVFYDGSGNYSNNTAVINAQGSLISNISDSFVPREQGLGTGISKRDIILLVDLSQDLFVIGNILGVKVIKGGEIIKNMPISINVSKGDMFVGNQFDAEKDGIWANIGVKYASRNQDFLLQIGNNNAIFNGNEINYSFEQIGVS